MSDSVWPQRWQPIRLPRPWDSLGKNTGVGCHFFLQCMKVKSESEVAQLCPTVRDPMNCSLPGSPVHGIFQARVLEWGAIAFSRNSLLYALKLTQYCKPTLFPLKTTQNKGIDDWLTKEQEAKAVWIKSGFKSLVLSVPHIVISNWLLLHLIDFKIFVKWKYRYYIYWKKSTYKGTCRVQKHVVQGSVVYKFEYTYLLIF